MNVNEIFAKSKENGGMTLLEHLKKCAISCYVNAINIGTTEKVAQLAFISGLFHDLGKCKKSFQEYLNDGKYEEHAETSAYLFEKLICIEEILSTFNIEDKEIIVRSILYHHPIDNQYNRSYELKVPIQDEDIKAAKRICKMLIAFYEKHFKSRKKFNLSISAKSEGDYCLSYFDGNYSVINVKNKETKYLNILNVLRFSDILSSYEEIPIDLERYLHNGLYKTEKVFNKPSDYDDRFYEQLEKANEISQYDFSILEAPTGFGKTMMGVIYLLTNDKKGYWVCPRNSIAESIYKTVKTEVEKLGFSDKISVALLLTNEYKHGDKNSDIIVTNIDNYVRPILKNDVKDLSMSMIYNNVIFDEFHEYVDSQLYGMFCSVVSARSMLKGVKTLLMSATMPPFNKTSAFYKYFRLGKYCLITRKDIKNKKITDKKYRVFISENIDSSVFGESTLVNLNTVSSAQRFYLNKWADRIIHSRFAEKDLKGIKDKLYVEHDKNAIRSSKDVYHNTSYSSTNMISTGVDVSFSNLVYNYIQPDRLIQLIGRVNRFSECVGEHPTIRLANSKFNERSEIMGILTNYETKLSNKFYEFLKKKIKDGDIIPLETLYDLRDEFYTDYAKDDIDKFMINVEKDSFKHLSNLPYTKNNRFDNNEDKYISNKVSLRNDGSYYNFWAIFKNDKTQQMSCPIQVDTMVVSDNFLSNDTIIKNALDYIENNNLVNEYFRNRYVLKNYRKSMSKAKEVLLRRAICDKTPLPVVSDYEYSEEIGIFNKNRT